MNKERRRQYILTRISEDFHLPLTLLAKEINAGHSTIKKDVRGLIRDGLIDKELWKTRNPHGHPIARETTSRTTREAMHRPEVREKNLAQLRKNSNDPTIKTYRSTQMKRLWQTEYRDRVSQIHKDKWANDEEYRTKQETRRRSPEWREELTRILNRAEVKAKVGEASKRHWQNPEYRENLTKQRQEQAPKQREIGLKLWRSPEYRSKQLPYVKRRKFDAGIHNSPKAGTVVYRSSYELLAFNLLDNDSNVLNYEVETVAIPYNFKGITRTYIIDLKVYHVGGQVLVIEIKPENQMNTPMNLAKFEAAREVFGDSFIVWTEKDLGK